MRLPDIQENQRTLMDLDMDMNIVFEENSPYQEGILSEFCQRLDHTYVQDATELVNLIDTDRMV